MFKAPKVMISAAVVTLALAGAAVAPLYAHNGEDHDGSSNNSSRSDHESEHEGKQSQFNNSRDAFKKEIEKKRSEIKERFKGRLDSMRKGVCEGRVDGIKKLMASAAESGAKHLAHFKGSQVRIDEFYKNKGLSVDNYDTLVAAANSKASIAQTAIDAVKANTDFSCDGDNPAESIDAFNGKIRTMYQALKDYRSSVKDILGAVKTAAKAKEGEAQ